MSKRKKIIIVVLVVILAVLFIPIPKTLDDGGTKVYSALTYKYVKWNRYVNDEHTRVFKLSRIYLFGNTRKSIDELFEHEMELYSLQGMEWKPVIYLYPESETDVKVSLDYKGRLTCTYPKYRGCWEVTASPDGTLTDKSGQKYNYLYWEGESSEPYDFSKGFCVKGEDTAKFLEEALEKLGLNRREANEFIVYWLPMMENNKYNVISFQTNAYTDRAKLDITPAPDTLLRVFMAWYKSDEFVDLPALELSSPERSGFTAVEWGGTQVK